MDKLFCKLLDALNQQTAHVGVIGLGYVGLPLAVSAAQKGFKVTGFDIDPEKIIQLDCGSSYVDAVSNQSLLEAYNSGRFDCTADFSRLNLMDAIVICVPTPLTRNRDPDISYVERTGQTIAQSMSAGTLVVLESTTFPGTTREVLTPILASNGLIADQDFWVGYSPEREDPGNSEFRTVTIPKIVAGDSDKAGALVMALYGGIVDRVVRIENTSTAEAVKITENVFRAVNIALVNELKIIFDSMGIDIWEVIDGAATKPFGYMPFYPGPGLGGHCIPIDPFYLTWKAREYGHSTRFIELAGEINSKMPYHVVSRLREVIDSYRGKGLQRARVLIVGVAYKKNVPDMRESPSMKIMELLAEAGAETDFIDPHVPHIPRMRNYPDLEGRRSVSAGRLAAGRYDVVVIATDHDDIDYLELAELKIPIVDTRNAFARRGLSMENVIKA